MPRLGQFQPEDMRIVRSTPLLSELPDHLIDTFVTEASVYCYQAGEILFCQGEAPKFLYLVLDGEVALHDSGDGAVIEIMTSGECFSTEALFTNLLYLAGAKVLQPSRIMLLPAETLRHNLLTVQGLAVAMLASLSIHFHKLAEETKALGLTSDSACCRSPIRVIASPPYGYSA